VRFCYKYRFQLLVIMPAHLAQGTGRRNNDEVLYLAFYHP